MNIEEKKIVIRTVKADKGKALKRIGTDIYFSETIMFENETEENFEEVDESEVPKSEEDENK